MSDKYPQYSNKEQEKNKPKTEEMINEIIGGERKIQALHFIAWLRENKLSPSWNSTNKWRVNYKGKVICYIYVSGCRELDEYEFGSWSIRPAYYENILGKANDESFDEWLKENTWKGVGKCRKCNNTCPPDGHSSVIYGKAFDWICGIWMKLVNPEDWEIEQVKKQILLIKESIAEMAANKI